MPVRGITSAKPKSSKTMRERQKTLKTTLPLRYFNTSNGSSHDFTSHLALLKTSLFVKGNAVLLIIDYCDNCQ